MSNTGELHWSNINPRTRTSIMIGLALGMLIACLDGTIVVTSLPSIMKDLGGNELYSWVFTGFMLCETIMIPIGGKLSDRYGRKPIFIAGILLFLLGSVLSGISGNMTELIVFRAIQGLGGGILIPVATAAVADLYSPMERGRIQGILGAIFAVAMCLGPFIGGYITDAASWHWIFYINVPIGAIALIFILRKFPTPEVTDTRKVDYTGMALLSVFLLDILLFFSWVGVNFEWISAQSVLMLVSAAVILAVFIWNEYRVADPVLSPRLFRGNVFVCCCICILIFGMGMMGVMSYLPIFMQVVVGMSATNTGEILLPMVIGMMITSMSSGFLVKRTGYKVWLVAGPMVTALGMFMLSTLHSGSDSITAMEYLFVTGLGLGCVMSVVMIAAQNSARKKEMGMVTSSVNLFRAIGSTVAVGVFTTFINSRMSVELAQALPPDLYDTLPHNIGILDYITQIPQEFVSGVINAYGDSVSFAFVIGAAVVLSVFVVALFMKAKPIKEIELEDPDDVA